MNGEWIRLIDRCITLVSKYVFWIRYQIFLCISMPNNIHAPNYTFELLSHYAIYSTKPYFFAVRVIDLFSVAFFDYFILWTRVRYIYSHSCLFKRGHVCFWCTSSTWPIKFQITIITIAPNEFCIQWKL